MSRLISAKCSVNYWVVNWQTMIIGDGILVAELTVKELLRDHLNQTTPLRPWIVLDTRPICPHRSVTPIDECKPFPSLFLFLDFHANVAVVKTLNLHRVSTSNGYISKSWLYSSNCLNGKPTLNPIYLKSPCTLCQRKQNVDFVRKNKMLTI